MRAKLIKGLLEVSLALALWPSVAAAHTLGISSGEYRAEGRSVHVRLAFAVADARALVPRLDADGDGRISALEATQGRDEVVKGLATALRIEGDGAPCVPSLTDAAPTEEDGFVVQLVYRCADVPREVSVVASFTETLAGGHRHVARTIGAATTDVLLSAPSRRASFHTSDGPAAAREKEGPRRAPFVVGAIMAIVGIVLLLARSKPKEPPPST